MTERENGSAAMPLATCPPHRGRLRLGASLALLAPLACTTATLDPVRARGGDGAAHAAEAADAGPGPAAPGASPPDGAPRPPTTGSYFPLAIGNRWTYEVQYPEEEAEKTVEVVGLEAVGGTGSARDEVAYKIVMSMRNGSTVDRAIVWMRWEGNRLVHHREDSYAKSAAPGPPTVLLRQTFYEPHRLRLPLERNEAASPTAAGWTESYRELVYDPRRAPAADPCAPDPTCGRSEEWTLVDRDQRVTLVLDGKPQTVSTIVVATRGPGATEKAYWFAPGIGKVKEAGRPGLGPTEELKSFSIAP